MSTWPCRSPHGGHSGQAGAVTITHEWAHRHTHRHTCTPRHKHTHGPCKHAYHHTQHTRGTPRDVSACTHAHHHTHTCTYLDIKSTRKCTYTNTRASTYKHRQPSTHAHSDRNTHRHTSAHTWTHTGTNAHTRTHTPHGDVRDSLTGHCSTRCWPLCTAVFSLQLFQVPGHPAFRILLDSVLEEWDPLSLKLQP